MAKNTTQNQSTEALTTLELISSSGQAENLLTVNRTVQAACSTYGRLKSKLRTIGTKTASLNKKARVMNQTVMVDTSALSDKEHKLLSECIKYAKAYKLLCGVWILDETAKGL